MGEEDWTPVDSVPGPPIQATATQCPTRVSEHRADEQVWVGQESRADQRTLVPMTLWVLGPHLGTCWSHRGRATARGWRSKPTELELGPAPVGIDGSSRPSCPLRARCGDSQNRLPPSQKEVTPGEASDQATPPIQVPRAEGCAPTDPDSFPPHSCCSRASVSFWAQSRASHET